MLYEYLILGAGASGLFFAANHKGGPVLLLDRQERPGRKILLSGGGKCNVTNLSVTPDNYIGSNPLFTREALAAFTPADMLNFLHAKRIATEEREHGQIFCKSGAEALRDALVQEAENNGVELALGQSIKSVKSIAEGEARFAIETESARHLGKNLLIACGGPAWPRSGSSFLGKKIAQDFGHKYIDPLPALTPLRMPKNWALHGLQGVSIKARVSTPSGPDFMLPLLFTHSGLSGPACLQASSYLKPQNGEELSIDFLPEESFARLLDAPEHAKQNPFTLLRRLLPERLAQAILSAPECAPFKERKNAELSRAARQAIASAVHGHKAPALAPGFEQAESSSGGIDTREIDPRNMQSRLVPGLYFTGEVLDVCGQLGGYNLHWAWASARLAGKK